MNEPSIRSCIDHYLSNRFQQHFDDLLIALRQITLSLILESINPYQIQISEGSAFLGYFRQSVASHISHIEQCYFDALLEDLACFVAERTCNGHKSSAPGVDLEFFQNDVHYVVSIKSGPNWGNSSQQKKLEEDLKTAVARIKQSRRQLNVQPVLGICYGKVKTSYLRGYMKVVGQSFWHLISGNKALYTEIIEPIGYRAREHNQAFSLAQEKLENRLILQFAQQFCAEDGAIDWQKLVEFACGNLDLDNV